MNIQKRFPVKTGLLTDVISRMMTRNIKNKVQRNAARMGFIKNTLDLSEHPERHLAVCMQILEKTQADGFDPRFETGLMMGACLACCAGDMKAIGVVRQLLTDLGRLQDDIDEVVETPTPEEAIQPTTEDAHP